MKNLVVGCLVVVGLALVALVVGVVFLVHESPNLEATLSVPAEATLNHPVELVVNTHNPHAEAVVLDSIDIDDSFLDGFQVLGTDPEAESSDHLPMVNQRSWSFSRSVAPNAGLAITFSLKPIQTGHFTGDIDVCNPSQDFKSRLADMVVVPANGSASRETPAEE